MSSNHTEGVDTDALVRRAQAGDRAAFTALVQAFSGPMYNLAYRMPIQILFSALAVSLGVSQVAALWPSGRAARLRIIEAIQYE